jgi:hypothetical protein
MLWRRCYWKTPSYPHPNNCRQHWHTIVTTTRAKLQFLEEACTFCKIVEKRERLRRGKEKKRDMGVGSLFVTREHSFWLGNREHKLMLIKHWDNTPQMGVLHCHYFLKSYQFYKFSVSKHNPNTKLTFLKDELPHGQPCHLFMLVSIAGLNRWENQGSLTLSY